MINEKTMPEIVKQETIGDYFVSTVKLGWPYDTGRPVYETCLFHEKGDHHSEVIRQYGSHEEAAEGHEIAADSIRFAVENK